MLIYFTVSITAIIVNYVDESNELNKKDILGLLLFTPPILLFAFINKLFKIGR